MHIVGDADDVRDDPQAARVSARGVPVVEVFGPTVQGEGIDQGIPCAFVRFGGCDYKCEWCDTPHAVLPELVREATRCTPDAIMRRLGDLSGPLPLWVVLSGGNPALHELGDLVHMLHVDKRRVSVETQGSRWKQWLSGVDRLCVSPKPPSSGMGNNLDQLAAFMANALVADAMNQDIVEPVWMFLKIVVFSEADLDYAELVHERWPEVPMFLSAGNDAGRTVAQPDRLDPRSLREVREDLLDDSEHLVDAVLKRPSMHDVRVQSQYHVLLWGNVQGV